jgi:hypothetical protein
MVCLLPQPTSFTFTSCSSGQTTGSGIFRMVTSSVYWLSSVFSFLGAAAWSCLALTVSCNRASIKIYQNCIMKVNLTIFAVKTKKKKKLSPLLCRSQVVLSGSSPMCRGHPTLWWLLSANPLLPPVLHTGLPMHPPVGQSPARSPGHHDPADLDWNTPHRPANCTSHCNTVNPGWNTAQACQLYKTPCNLDCGCIKKWTGQN